MLKESAISLKHTVLVVSVHNCVVLVLYIRGVNRAEISGPARKIVFRPGPQSMYYKICTVKCF